MSLRDTLEEAGAHAMHQRAVGMPCPRVELHVLPVGIEVDAWQHSEQTRRVKRLIGWDTIEHAKFNVLVTVIDELMASFDKR